MSDQSQPVGSREELDKKANGIEVRHALAACYLLSFVCASCAVPASRLHPSNTTALFHSVRNASSNALVSFVQ